MINWKIRIQNKLFWLAIIPAVLVLIKCVLNVFGIDFDFTDIQDKLIDIVGALFMVLSILGIVTDHTTDGIGDSANAMLYDEPKRDDDFVVRDDSDRKGV